jgi:prepilin-type N-terminal cleavage/methylation domain-containing protein
MLARIDTPDFRVGRCADIQSLAPRRGAEELRQQHLTLPSAQVGAMSPRASGVPRSGFSLVELLVVIALLAVLAGLLLPAVQATRESARLTQCRNNMRQISTALLAFHEQSGRFPRGGWGHEWIPVAKRGAGKGQPGGWVFNLLPFLEQQSLHDRLDGQSPAATALLATPVPTFTCPTRRPCQAWPTSPRYAYMQNLKPTGNAAFVARGDYAINAGATLATPFPGPPDLATGDGPSVNWPINAGPAPTMEWSFTGISHVRTGTSLAQVEDGSSNTYLAGEKFIDVDHYEDGEFLGDNEALYSGYCSDNHRFTKLIYPPARDAPVREAPPAEWNTYQFRFGSAHQAGALLAYCDGSVQLVSFDVSDEVHYRAGNMADAGIKLSSTP